MYKRNIDKIYIGYTIGVRYEISDIPADIGKKAAKKVAQINNILSEFIARAYVNTLSFFLPDELVVSRTIFTQELQELELLKVKTFLLEQRLVMNCPPRTIKMNCPPRTINGPPGTINRALLRNLSE